jgi:hypothetical protein
VGYRRGALESGASLKRSFAVVRKKKQVEVAPSGEASIHIEDDSLAIVTAAGLFRLPKQAVDELVSSLVISGFGPQTPAQFNTILTFRDIKLQNDAEAGRHT